MTRVQKVLKCSYLFCDLTREELQYLEQMGTLYEYSRFEPILKEGEANDRLSIVIEGSVSIAMKNAFLGILNPGQHFGEMALLDGQPSAASIIADGETTVFSIPHEKITAFVSTPTSCGYKILMAIARELCIRLRRTGALLKEANQQNMIDEKELESFLSEIHGKPIP